MNDQNSFKGKLGNYSFIETLDGSVTLHSDFFDENLHNLKGAYEETFFTYINGSKLSRMFEDQNLASFSLLEVGFGMGLGLYAVDKYLNDKYLNDKFLNDRPLSQKIHFHFVSFEIDGELISWQIENDQQMKNHYSPTSLPKLSEWHKEELKIQNESFVFYKVEKEISPHLVFSGILLIGDGRKVLQPWFRQNSSWPKFHAIFQDAFSPKKNPDLWTVEWFKELYQLSAKEVILSTYSSATAIRRSLFEAKWNVLNQKAFAHKKAMTVATIDELTLGPMNEDLKLKIENTPIPAYRDQDQSEFVKARDKKMQSN